jgi:hypothetical protein
MKREPQLSALLLCVALALLAFLVNASLAAAQGNSDTNGQNNNGRGDDGFAVKQGPGTNLLKDREIVEGSLLSSGLVDGGLIAVLRLRRPRCRSDRSLAGSLPRWPDRVPET